MYPWWVVSQDFILWWALLLQLYCWRFIFLAESRRNILVASGLLCSCEGEGLQTKSLAHWLVVEGEALQRLQRICRSCDLHSAKGWEPGSWLSTNQARMKPMKWCRWSYNMPNPYKFNEQGPQVRCTSLLEDDPSLERHRRSIFHIIVLWRVLSKQEYVGIKCRRVYHSSNEDFIAQCLPSSLQRLHGDNVDDATEGCKNLVAWMSQPSCFSSWSCRWRVHYQIQIRSLFRESGPSCIDYRWTQQVLVRILPNLPSKDVLDNSRASSYS